MIMATKALVVNLFGGPGTGKSTTMAGTFNKMKLAGINCEMVSEYAKDLVWQESFKVLENQIYVFGKQYHRLFRTMNQLDVVITDSPILLSLYYNGGKSPSLEQLILERHWDMDTLNVMLRRVKEYNPAGRYQTEDEAKGIDSHIYDMLLTYRIPFIEISANEFAPDKLLPIIQRRLENA